MAKERRDTHLAQPTPLAGSVPTAHSTSSGANGPVEGIVDARERWHLQCGWTSGAASATSTHAGCWPSWPRCQSFLCLPAN